MNPAFKVPQQKFVGVQPHPLVRHLDAARRRRQPFLLARRSFQLELRLLPVDRVWHQVWYNVNGINPKVDAENFWQTGQARCNLMLPQDVADHLVLKYFPSEFSRKIGVLSYQEFHSFGPKVTQASNNIGPPISLTVRLIL